MDLEVSTALTIPAAELGWRFSRSSGPGGQHVNTSDSRVELSWNVVGSAALSDGQRIILVTRLGPRLTAGTVTVTASERRSQLRNREIAKLQGAVTRQGLTLVPLSIYFNASGRAKVEIALARGKKVHDNRETMKERDWKREQQRLLRHNG